MKSINVNERMRVSPPVLKRVDEFFISFVKECLKRACPVDESQRVGANYSLMIEILAFAVDINFKQKLQADIQNQNRLSRRMQKVEFRLIVCAKKQRVCISKTNVVLVLL